MTVTGEHVEQSVHALPLPLSVSDCAWRSEHEHEHGGASGSIPKCDRVVVTRCTMGFVVSRPVATA